MIFISQVGTSANQQDISIQIASSHESGIMYPVPTGAIGFVSLFITARKRSLRRLCFYKCLSFCPRGVCFSACWDTTPPPSRHRAPLPPPTSRHHPPGPGTPRPGMPPGAGTPWDQAPAQSSACWEIRSTRGRYASYWNAILFTFKSMQKPMLRSYLHMPLAAHTRTNELHQWRIQDFPGEGTNSKGAHEKLLFGQFFP